MVSVVVLPPFIWTDHEDSDEVSNASVAEDIVVATAGVVPVDVGIVVATVAVAGGERPNNCNDAASNATSGKSASIKLLPCLVLVECSCSRCSIC